jgi:two-component system, chemotaxis family, protein-glutamate methylesterase/glutaminase
MVRNLQPHIIVIGASSGGLEPLMEIVRDLPADLPAALFIVVHVPPQATSQLPQILSRAGRLPAIHPKDYETIRAGTIYIAPPDFHLLLRRGDMRVVRGPRENNHRPAIDALFRTAARVYGPQVIGIVLSGMLDDGTAGLFAIKSRGGLTIVQDPKDALFPDMPRNALAAVQVDYLLPQAEIATVIAELIQRPISAAQGATMAPDKNQVEKDQMEIETKIEALEAGRTLDEEKPGTPAVYGCPECGGTLWEMQDEGWPRFRCRVGHAYSADGLLRTQGESLEAALWSAYRILHENASLARRLAKRAQGNKNQPLAEKFDRNSRLAADQAELIRELLLSGRIKDEANRKQEG